MILTLSSVLSYKSWFPCLNYTYTGFHTYLDNKQYKKINEKFIEAFRQTLEAQNTYTLFIVLFQFLNYHITLKLNLNNIHS